MSQWEKCELEFDQKYTTLLADLKQHKELINEQLFCTKEKMDLEFKNLIQNEKNIHQYLEEIQPHLPSIRERNKMLGELLHDENLPLKDETIVKASVPSQV